MFQIYQLVVPSRYFLALRPTGAAPKIIAARAVFAGLFHPMHHRLAAFFAELARGFGELLHLFRKVGHEPRL